MIDNVIDGVIADLRKRSKNSIYLTDPVAWAHDVLGKHMYIGGKDGWWVTTKIVSIEGEQK